MIIGICHSKGIINHSFIESLSWLSKERNLLLISSLSSFFLIAWVQFLFKEIYFFPFCSYSQSLCLISFFAKFLKCLFASSNLVVASLFIFCWFILRNYFILFSPHFFNSFRILSILQLFKDRFQCFARIFSWIVIWQIIISD